MNSSVEIFPLVLSTILSFLTVHSSLLGKPIIWLVDRKSKKERELYAQKQRLKHEQSALNMIDNFAKYSKLQRKINAIDSELLELSSQKTKARFIINFVASLGLRIVFSVILIVLSMYYRNTPVFHMSPDFDFVPFTTIISYPNKGNDISFHFWAMCCTAIAKLLN